MQLLGINHLEVKIVCTGGGGSVLVPLRVLASNPTGYAIRVETYYEVSSCFICRTRFRVCQDG